MARKSSHTFVQSKMNKDLDARLLEAGQYRDGVNVSVSRSEGSDVGALENILGNEFLSDFNVPNTVGDNNPLSIIGWRFYIESDLVFVFVTNYQDNSDSKISNLAPYNSYHAIACYNIVDKTSKVIVEGKFLNFSINSRINDVDIIEDLLFWTDNRNQPRKINWRSALENPNYYFSEDQISVAKYYPYKPLDLVNEIVFEDDAQAVYVFKNIGDGTENACFETANRYDAINDFFVFPGDPSQSHIDAMKKLIGARAYVIGKKSLTNNPPTETTTLDTRVEFKVCWFQKDGEDEYGNVIPTRLPGKLAGKYMLFIDRSIRNGPTVGIEYTEPGVTPLNPIPYENLYDIHVLKESVVEVSDAWEDNLMAKIQVVSVNTLNNGDSATPSVSFIDTSVGGAITYDQMFSNYLSQVYLYGTRSTGRDLNNVWQEDCLSATPPITWPDSYLPMEPPTFWFKDGFPSNTNLSGGDDPSLSARNILPRIKHPKIPEDDIICIWKQRIEDSTGLRNIGFYTVKLESKTNTKLYEICDVYDEYAIVEGDILSIYLPNQDYEQEFVGDEVFLNDKFVRFSYRYKFDDGEYSVIAPFTQPVFIPKQNGFFEQKIKAGSGSVVGDLPAGQVIQHDVMQAGQNTEVEWFTNKVTKIGLKIDLDYEARELFSELKVIEIDILYKESSQNILKVIETIDVKSNTDEAPFILYDYNGKKPIKALESGEIGRVYDNVPVRAKTQSTSGNRIIYGNFFDKHTSPLALDYSVGASSKFTQAFPESTNSVVRYPNHTLKQNRSYQVGIVLQDRYGRSTDVILSPKELSYLNGEAPSRLDGSLASDRRFANSEIKFEGDTIYHPYLFNTRNLYQFALAKNNSQFEKLGGIPTKISGGSLAPLDSVNPRAGMPDWPGDSLKVLFTDVIPASISRPGYPGLYEEFIDTFDISTVSSGTSFNCDEIWEVESSSTAPISFVPGLVVRWEDDAIGKFYGTTKEGDVTFVESSENAGTITYQIGIILQDNTLSTPVDTAVELLKYNPLGFYSGKFVVKQQEQTYYNVYTASLLKGNPLVKPFKLNIVATTASTKILEVDDNLHPTPQTFPILEGMYFESTTGLTTNGIEKVSVVNILNDTQFEVSQPVEWTGGELEFKMDSNENTLNVTTLLTDNANKVPPSLIETTPVQQQYSTSDTRLIPRVAMNNISPIVIGPTFSEAGFEPVANKPTLPYVDYTFPIYPKKETLKVRSIGNFESLFIDGKYAGLWQADTNPPTAIIENKFQLGRTSTTAVNPPSEILQPAIYETTPTFSELEIYYESSTSFNITELNKRIETKYQDADEATQFDNYLRKVNSPYPLVEIDFYNSYWMKSIFNHQPAFQLRYATNGFLGTTVGNNTSRGVFPLTNLYCSPGITTQAYPPSFGAESNKGDKDIRDSNWYIEESFIKGGYNNTETDLGARAFLDQDEPIQQHRFNSLIYSGVFNSRTGINRTNEFPTGQVLTRSANPENGAVQKIYAEEGNLLVLQEDKCNRALIDKDTIYTAEGGTQTQAAGTVIGQITPYKGQYGISENPESFAIYGFRKYFADVNRSCMLRLSHDGITEVSEYGMRDWFRDNLADVNNKFTNEFKYIMTIDCVVDSSYCSFDASIYITSDVLSNVLLGSELYKFNNTTSEFEPTGVFVNEITQENIYFNNILDFSGENVKIALVSKNRSYIVGGWDIYNKQYVCSLQYNKSSSRDYTLQNKGSKNYEYYTLGFDETTSGWTSFYTFRPGFMNSLKNIFYTINDFYSTWSGTGIGDFGLYKHYADNNTLTNRGYFYGNHEPSSVTIIANSGPSVQKTFIAIDYEGNSGWETSFIISDSTGYELPEGYYEDTAQFIASYENGQYVDQYTGFTLRAGFDRKDNRYVANIVNNTGNTLGVTANGPIPGQVLIGEEVTGIKGYYCEVKMSTDDSTNLGGVKELYQVSATYNVTAT